MLLPAVTGEERRAARDLFELIVERPAEVLTGLLAILVVLWLLAGPVVTVLLRAQEGMEIALPVLALWAGVTALRLLVRAAVRRLRRA
ncbi:hypothetical protein GCM10010420_15570 [Streptomyces glaucosporus]|uniref:Integral membrane protein n=1 Tax=Streptomyces glaucosporus TaxID=284044 RepID=A0ABP5V1L6_9ACTN